MHKVTIIRNVFITSYYTITTFGNKDVMIEMAQNNKKKLKKADVEIMDRILVALYEIGCSKKTTISRRTKMSYDNCMMYLEHFEARLFVKRHIDSDGSETFALTSHGINVCKQILSEQFELKQLEQKKKLTTEISV